MLGTKAGRESWWNTMIQKHGSKEAVIEVMRQFGVKGGLTKNPNKGFGADRERASAAGRKGGLKSKRGTK